MTVTDDDVFEYLEHFGIKGMHWGVRRGTTPSPGFSKRSAKQKAAIIGTAAASGFAGAYVTRHLKTPLRAIGIGSFAAVGGNAAALLLDKHGQKKINAPASKEKNLKPPKETRKQKKARTMNENQKLATDIFNAAVKNPNGLVLLNGRQIVTTKEFVDHLANGGLMDINSTVVYRRREDQ